MWTNKIVKNIMLGAGTAVGAGAMYSLYQHQKREDIDSHNVYKAQEVDATAVRKVTPPTITERPEVFMGDSIVLDDFTIRDKIRGKLQGSTADHETAHKLKGARDYAVGSVETTVKDAAQAVKGPQRSSIGYALETLQGYKDQLVGAVETRAKDFQHSVKHARDEAKHKHEDLSERMKAEKEHLKTKVDRDVNVLEGKAKDATYKIEKETDKMSNAIHKGVEKLEYGAEKTKADIMSGAHNAKVAVVHGAEVALDKTSEIASDLAKKAEHAKEVAIVKGEEFAEKSKEVSKDLWKKSKDAADSTVAVAKTVGSATAVKSKEAANVAGDVFLKTGKAAESVVKPVAGTVVNATEQVGEKYEQAKDHLYVYVKEARDRAAIKKAEADAKRTNAGMDKKQIEKEIENINDVQRY